MRNYPMDSLSDAEKKPEDVGVMMSHLSGVRANRAAKRLGERINVDKRQSNLRQTFRFVNYFLDRQMSASDVLSRMAEAAFRTERKTRKRELCFLSF